jgi:methylated-DNA-[protein]-cysteine S-methyltransferase
MNTTLIVDSPLGPLALTCHDGVALAEIRPLAHVGEGAVRETAPPPVLLEAKRKLAKYFRGDLRTFDLPLAPRGTPFQTRVWHALSSIPFGTTYSYGELARLIGAPHAARAVGRANGRNPIPIVVPCHRVVGANGDLTGFAWGLDRKRWLIGHEVKSLADNQPIERRTA